jgi:hypothetical protein
MPYLRIRLNVLDVNLKRGYTIGKLLIEYQVPSKSSLGRREIIFPNPTMKAFISNVDLPFGNSLSRLLYVTAVGSRAEEEEEEEVQIDPVTGTCV